MSKTVIGIFETFDEARGAREALEQSDLRHEGVVLQSSQEFIARRPLTDAGGAGDMLRRGVEQFLDEFGVTAPDDQRAIDPDDGILMVVTPDEGADAMARFLDEQGAIDIDARRGRSVVDDAQVKRAGGLETNSAGRTPPGMPRGEPGWTGSNDPTSDNPAERQRSAAEQRARMTCARIFNC